MKKRYIFQTVIHNKERMFFIALNRVLSGDYAGKQITGGAMNATLVVGFMKKIFLNRLTVEKYEVLGGISLGKIPKGSYQVKISFKDGKQSQIEVDEKIYKAIVQACS